MEQQTYYVQKLKSHLFQKQKDNSSYSLRAFARDLDIHSSTLSQILKGKRGLPLKKAATVASKLSLPPKEMTLFMESFYRTKTSLDDIKISHLDERFMLDESYYQVIAEWEHYAVLELFNLKEFEFSKKNISKKLKLDTHRVDVVISNLITCELLKEDPQGNMIPAHSDVKTTEDIKSNALKESHKETLQMGINKIDEIEVALRDFSSTTVAIDLSQLPEAKTIIREFRQKMSSLLRDGQNKTDVYQLAIQFYPITEINE